MSNTPSLAVCIASHNTLTSRKEGLDNCLESLRKSVTHFQEKHPEVAVSVSWVDDASTDQTWEYVQEHLNLPLIGTKLKCCSHQGYARNLAAKLTNATYLTFCDSDDRFLKEHLAQCFESISCENSEYKKYGIAYTQARIDPALGIHPDWKQRISYTIPITKIIHRTAWEFVEGFPVHEIYKSTGAEDQDLMMLLGSIFKILRIDTETVEYCCYPNSFFERQLPKFRQDPASATLTADEQAKLELHRAREVYIQAKLELLKAKLIHGKWHEKLEDFAVNYQITAS